MAIPNRPEYQSDLFKKGLEVRRAVLGAEYVDGSLARADDFFASFQKLTTEYAWGEVWTRPSACRSKRSARASARSTRRSPRRRCRP